jgi:hypothetical protein
MMTTATMQGDRRVLSERSIEQKISRVALATLPWIAVLGSIIMLAVPAFLVPAEDATILYQYSDNWASTGQISYYHGGPRVEGATDFLWMALLAGLRVLHIPPFWAAAVINLLSALTISYLILRLAQRKPNFRSMLFLLGVIMLAPQLGAALAGFSVLPFAALLLTCVFFFCNERDMPLAAACLLLCLFRPDGVVFAFPLLVLRVFSEKRGFPRRLGIMFAFFVVPGLLYFVLRWKYFGEFFPLPFLVKSDTPRFLGVALGESNLQILKYLAFDAILLWLVLGRALGERKNLRLLAALGIFPTLFYLTMRLDQNIGDRFFAYLLVCSAVLVAVNWEKLGAQRVRTIAVFVVLWCIFLSFSWATSMSYCISDGYQNIIVSVARQLRDVKPNGILEVSEAGRISYFSGWQTIDVWGLNTPEFAHRLFSPGDVRSISPDVVVLYVPDNSHDCRLHPGWNTPHTTRTLTNLQQNVITGVHDAGNYDLWMVPSSGFLRRAIRGTSPGAGQYECWFVKQTFAGHDQVARILADHAALPAAQYFQIRFGTPSSDLTTR